MNYLELIKFIANSPQLTGVVIEMYRKNNTPMEAIYFLASLSPYQQKSIDFETLDCNDGTVLLVYSNTIKAK